MSRMKATATFVLQSAVIGLAAAFVLVWLEPELLVPDRSEPAERPAPSRVTALSYADAVARSAPAVANVYATRIVRTGPGERILRVPAEGLGSAVVLNGDGLIVTNYHVIKGADQLRLQFADGRIADPELIGFDEETDLALLKVDLPDLPSIVMGRSDTLRTGDVVLAIGNPFGLSQTVTQGIVSATGRGQLRLMTFEDFIQTDAAINSGNSGGALVNARGELVGINTAVLSNKALTEGIGFAIPVNLVRGVVGELLDHGRVVRGYLGVIWEPHDLTPSELAARNLPESGALLIKQVYRDSPAWRAGLRRGDVILAINGEPITSGQQALLKVAGLAPGETVVIDAQRGDTPFQVRAEVTERPS